MYVAIRLFIYFVYAVFVDECFIDLKFIEINAYYQRQSVTIMHLT